MAIHTAYSVRMKSRYAASTRSSAVLPASEPKARRRRPPKSPPMGPSQVSVSSFPDRTAPRQDGSPPALQVLARRPGRDLGLTSVMAADQEEVEVGDRVVRISNPGRVYFPARGETKLDL